MTEWYDQCKCCHHTFKPTKLTFRQVYNREYCFCLCHWGDSNAGGITCEEALDIALSLL